MQPGRMTRVPTLCPERVITPRSAPRAAPRDRDEENVPAQPQASPQGPRLPCSDENPSRTSVDQSPPAQGKKARRGVLTQAPARACQPILESTKAAPMDANPSESGLQARIFRRAEGDMPGVRPVRSTERTRARADWRDGDAEARQERRPKPGEAPGSRGVSGAPRADAGRPGLRGGGTDTDADDAATGDRAPAPRARTASDRTGMTGHGLVVGLLDGSLRVYQALLSPWLGGQCRFHPSCSAYAREAIAVHGPGRGLALSVGRVLRCQPLCRGGNDPVPPRAGAGNA